MKRIRIIMTIFLAILLLQGGEVQPTMAATGQSKQALIVVDPGFSRFSLKIAQAIAAQLAQKQYGVKLKTVKQFKPVDLKAVDLLVLGGPTYMKQPSNGLKKAVASLDAGYRGPALLFITGGAECGGLEPLHHMVQTKGLTIIGEITVSTQSKVSPASAVKPLLDKI